MRSFIDENKIEKLLSETRPDKGRVREIIQKALSKKRLELEETAALLNVKSLRKRFTATASYYSHHSTSVMTAAMTAPIAPSAVPTGRRSAKL
jgi:hypothetical protein